MSILLAGTGAAVAASGIVLNYSKAQYNEKITELESYYSMLETHLSRMEELKSQMYEFWNDEDARNAARALQEQIDRVKTQMLHTSLTLTSFRTTVTEMDSTKSLVGSDLEKAISAVTSLK